MEKLYFNCYVLVERSGLQRLGLSVSPRKFHVLSALGMSFENSKDVEVSLQEIKKVARGEKDFFLLQNHDITVVEVFKVESIVRDDMGLATPVKCPTSEIVALVQEWLSFIKAYENGEIPGIIPDTKKDEWVIVKNNG